MRIIQTVLLLLIIQIAFSQELPPIKKFTTENYLGDNQNWMISQGLNDFIYVANNKGLLEYNGAEWTTYTSPNNTIIRAVNVIQEKIYTGCYGEFGYWIKNEFGTLNYVSLSSKLNIEMLEDEEVWNIIEYNEWAVFQSNSKIYFYNYQNQAFKIINATNTIYKIFKVKNQLYYHVADEGIYTIEEGKPKLITAHPITKTQRIINIYNNDDNLLILTRNSGFYKLETFLSGEQDNKLIPWKIKGDKALEAINVFSSIVLDDGSFMLGTISDGVIHISKNGTIDYQINQKNGLSNNTVLTLFEDKTNNVWAGLDNGINCINVTSAVKTFFDYDGVLGTLYSTQVFDNKLYIGSNQGLFYRDLNAINNTFKFIEGTAGQVWDLFNFNNEYLFCGHHLGTFVITNNTATKISNELGAWTFKNIPNRKNMLLQGNYNGLYILEKVNNSWSVKNKIEGFKNSSRYIEIDANNQIWVSHEYKGVFKLKLNDSLTKVQKLDMETSLVLGKNSSLIKYKNQIHYASEEGLFIYNEDTKTFERDAVLSNIIHKEDYISGKLVVDKNEKLWAFSKDNISYLENDDVTNKPIIKNISISSKLRKGVLGYENISLTDKSTYVLGTANGYLTLDLALFDKEIDYTIYLNSVSVQDVNDVHTAYELNKNAAFKYKQGLISFNYSVPEYYKYSSVKYQHILEGQSTKWSKWTENTSVTFENLSFGDYTLKVRAKIGNTISKNTISYSFKVHRPWFLSNTALFVYFLIFLLIIIVTHRAYKRYYIEKFKHEQLENQQTIMQIKNEKLNQDIENKNRELAISTMSIIKKNKLLNKIKYELKKAKHKDNNVALKLIDNNLNDAKDWSFFEQAFNNADKDFLEKIKNTHPDLTPNDLRFCAYLRLNLNSKEIASLLNISLKSVETKRYRLRKKLGLEHTDGLIDHILKF
jgi:ligand-binding sensor domain-containing protein/DNA-binding CsgD family transcriptional regulator